MSLPVLFGGDRDQALEGRSLGGHRGAEEARVDPYRLLEHEVAEQLLRRQVAAQGGLERDPVARREAGLDDHREGHVRGALLTHREDLDPVPDPFVDRVGKGFEVFDVADGLVPFHPVEAIEDRAGYLGDTRIEALGQQGATVSKPLRPTRW